MNGFEDKSGITSETAGLLLCLYANGMQSEAVFPIPSSELIASSQLFFFRALRVKIIWLRT